MWIFKIKEMACVDYITSGRLRNSTFEFIHSLPLDLKKKVLGEIKDHSNLIDWYENKKEPVLPKELPETEINFESLENLSRNSFVLE